MNSDDVLTMRKPVSAFFMIDSGDRNLTGAGTGRLSDPDVQPWNDFKISKPQPLLDGFARNMGVTEVYFPWTIPNVTSYNNTFYIRFVVGGLKTITVPIDFYTGTSLAAAIQVQLNALVGIGGSPPVIEYDEGRRIFTFTPVGGNGFELYANLQETTDYKYFQLNASLLKTMGFAGGQMGTNIISEISGGSTLIRYTNYVDIISNRLHYDSEMKDGDTSVKTVRDVLCRIYCANEISTPSADVEGQTPFLIHRQFMTPKYFRLNPRQFFNAIDIQVLDQYGNLVYIPPRIGNPIGTNPYVTYPDFYLTCIGSEQ
jgi:hypothetical protein